jgi:excisionase family DNA binding protein
MTTTGNSGLDALADAIAERVVEKIKADQEPTYISAKEVARRMGRSLRTIHHMAKTGAIPSERQGSRVMFRWADVQRTLDE